MRRKLKSLGVDSTAAGSTPTSSPLPGSGTPRLRDEIASNHFHSAKWQIRCLPGVGALQALGMIGDDLAEDLIEANSDFPFGIVRLELGKIGDVADVVALAVLFDVLPI